jgi:hypothetical protein
MMPEDKHALIQVWGKGFRVTTDSEEFQRLVPIAESKFETERQLRRFSGWSTFIEQLKPLSERELNSQFLMLLRPDHISIVAVAKSEDKYGRWSPVVVMATMEVDWLAKDLDALVAKLSALAKRLASEYATIFKGARSNVQQQLKENSFLPDRRFALQYESDAESSFWTDVVGAVREWQGIFGLATPHLISLGANVGVGTRHELSQLEKKLDGRFDANEKCIESTGDALRPWPKKAAEIPKPPEAQRPDLQRVEKHLASMDSSLRTISNSIDDFFDLVERLFGGPNKK